MRFDERSENFFENFSLLSVRAENVIPFHFTTEEMKSVLAKNPKTFLRKFLLPLLTGGQILIWSKISEIFFPHFTTEELSPVFSMKLIFFYMKFLFLAYMGEMSTLLHFTTEEQKAVLAKNEQKNSRITEKFCKTASLY